MNKDSIETHLRFYKDNFESIKEKANQESIDADPNDEDAKDELLFSNAKINLDEIYVEDKEDVLQVQGQLWALGKELAWIDMKIPLDQEIAVGVIDRYLKKLGKLKTVLEATKD